jgi:competence ComEA-like helix-hairpin-helix protein
MNVVRSVWLPWLTLAAAAQTLPDAPGKAVVERMCSQCHSLESVVSARMTKDGWAGIVDDMVSRGANGSADDIDRVVNYLAANFGKSAGKKVNVNKATAAELVAALDISAADAAAIVSYRADKGRFKELRDVTNVPGIDTSRIEAARDRLEF